jgi:hypothetical protein
MKSIPQFIIRKSLILMLFGFLFITSSCKTEKKISPQINNTDVIHQNEDQLTQVIIYDVFSPPVASRLYVYASLATYEAIRFSNDEAASLTEKLKGFKPMPVPEKNKK